MRQILLILIRTSEDKRDHQRIAELVGDRDPALEMVLNGRLNGRDYVMGERFTMADIVFGPHIYRWFTYPIERPELPYLRACIPPALHS